MHVCSIDLERALIYQRRAIDGGVWRASALLSDVPAIRSAPDIIPIGMRICIYYSDQCVI